MSYVVAFTLGAEDDLLRLYDFLLDRAETLEELATADEAIEVIINHAPALETVPWQAKRNGWDAEIEELSAAEWKITLTRKVAAGR